MRRVRLFGIGLAILLCATLPASRASDGPASLAELARDAFAGEDWETASRLYRTLSNTAAADADTWSRLAVSTLNAEQDPGLAIDAYEHALALGAPAGPSHYGIARAKARLSDKDGALKSLAIIAEGGPSLGISLRIENEPAFDFLRSNAAFSEVAKRLRPCASDEYRQFDFWLGTWQVTSPMGVLLGKNTVMSTLDGCMLTENWESVSGFRGMSINYFDSSDGTWNQTFRDNTGNVSGWPDLKGQFSNGVMVLETKGGEDNRSRWTWTILPDGRVLQKAESSSDGGETWTVGWDSVYTRIEDSIEDD